MGFFFPQTVTQISPPEFTAAALFGIEALVQTGASDDVLQTARKAILSVTIRYEVIQKGTDQKIRALQLRSDIHKMGAAVQRTPVQSMYDTMELKRELEKSCGHSLGAQATAEMWLANLKSDNGQMITEVSTEKMNHAHSVIS